MHIATRVCCFGRERTQGSLAQCCQLRPPLNLCSSFTGDLADFFLFLMKEGSTTMFMSMSLDTE